MYFIVHLDFDLKIPHDSEGIIDTMRDLKNHAEILNTSSRTLDQKEKCLNKARIELVCIQREITKRFEELESRERNDLMRKTKLSMPDSRNLEDLKRLEIQIGKRIKTALMEKKDKESIKQANVLLYLYVFTFLLSFTIRNMHVH